jgi:hypothetical protein
MEKQRGAAAAVAAAMALGHHPPLPFFPTFSSFSENIMCTSVRFFHQSVIVVINVRAAAH